MLSRLITIIPSRLGMTVKECIEPSTLMFERLFIKKHRVSSKLESRAGLIAKSLRM